MNNNINLEEYYQSKHKINNPGFLYSIRTLSAQQKKAMTALYVFCREIDDIIDETKEPAIAEIKLNFWSQEIDRIFMGSPLHPVSQTLSEVCHFFSLPQALFKEFINGMQMDLIYSSYPNFDALYVYCNAAAASVAVLTAKILGYEDSNTVIAVKHFATALQLINIIRDIGQDIRIGRVYIPLDELEYYKVSKEDLRAGIYSTNYLSLMQHQAKRAKDYYQQGLRCFPEQDLYAQRSGLIMMKIYLKLLEEIERSQFQVLHQKIRLTPLRKLWIAFSTERKIKRKKFKLCAAL